MYVKRLLMAAVIGLTGTVVATQSYAQCEGPYCHSMYSGCTGPYCGTPPYECLSAPYGWYLEIFGGSSKVSGQDFDFSDHTSSSGIGGGANIGYKFMPFFALEIGYTRYANTNIEIADVKVATVQNYSYDIAAKGIIPLAASGFELFAKIGAGRAVANLDVKDQFKIPLGVGDQRHSTTGVFMGVGGQYYFMPELAVVVQWARANGNEHSGYMDLFSVGVSFIVD